MCSSETKPAINELSESLVYSFSKLDLTVRGIGKKGNTGPGGQLHYCCLMLSLSTTTSFFNLTPIGRHPLLISSTTGAAVWTWFLVLDLRAHQRESQWSNFQRLNPFQALTCTSSGFFYNFCLNMANSRGTPSLLALFAFCSNSSMCTLHLISWHAFSHQWIMFLLAGSCRISGRGAAEARAGVTGGLLQACSSNGGLGGKRVMVMCWV